MSDGTRRTPAARLLGAGARSAERVAAATGVDKAIEDGLEEAIVRALRSPAVERALVRAFERNAVQDAIARSLTSDEVARAIIDALDTPVADQVWAELLASGKAQTLVERIAEAPEVRAAIAQQGVGLVTDVGRRLTTVTEALDDALEILVHRVLRRGGHEQETDQVGLLTRTVAAGIDVALLSGLFSIASGVVTSVFPAAAGFLGRLPLIAAITFGVLGFAAGGAIVATFWALVGQTPGMRLLSIRLDVAGSGEVGLRRALRRLLALPLAVAPFGLGVLAILVSPTRRGWHDHAAGTTVVYDHRRTVAPHSGRSGAGARPEE